MSSFIEDDRHHGAGRRPGVKAEMTHSVSREIVKQEAAARNKQIEKLKAARLARDAAAPAAEVVEKAKPKRRPRAPAAEKAPAFPPINPKLRTTTG